MPSRPHLPAAYDDMNGRARTATSEETKTKSPRWRSTMPGHERPHQPLRAGQVEVDLAGEPLRVDLVDGAGRDRAGVADHDLDVAEVAGDGLREGGHRLAVGEVERVDDGLAAGLAHRGGDLLALLGTAGAERDRVTGGGEGERGGGADAGGGAGDDGGAPGGLGVLAHRGHHRHRRDGEAADVDRVHPSARIVVDLDGAHPLDERRQRDPGLEPGQVGAQAEVPAAAEGQDLGQLVGIAGDVELRPGG